jgi:hypothetical protein
MSRRVVCTIISSSASTIVNSFSANPKQTGAQWPMRHGRSDLNRSVTLLASLLLLSGSAAGAERQILDDIENGTIQLDTEVAIPSGNASMPTPGSENEPASFIVKLTKAQEKTITDKAYPLMLAKWPFNLISVCWENSAPTNDLERTWVRDAITNSWQRSSALQFVGWEKCGPNTLGVRINIDDVGPYARFLGKFLAGVKSGMVLNFTFQAWGQSCTASEAQRKGCVESIAVHEFGHAIGFAHEQNRPDTPGECSNLRQGTNGDRIDITPWDPHSVMNYCNPIYNNNGALSEFDIQAVQYIYGVPSK